VVSVLQDEETNNIVPGKAGAQEKLHSSVLFPVMHKHATGLKYESGVAIKKVNAWS